MLCYMRARHVKRTSPRPRVTVPLPVAVPQTTLSLARPSPSRSVSVLHQYTRGAAQSDAHSTYMHSARACHTVPFLPFLGSPARDLPPVRATRTPARRHRAPPRRDKTPRTAYRDLNILRGRRQGATARYWRTTGGCYCYGLSARLSTPSDPLSGTDST